MRMQIQLRQTNISLRQSICIKEQGSNWCFTFKKYLFKTEMVYVIIN